MITTASKLLFAAAAVALVAAMVYGYGTDATFWGPPTLGLKGAVGEQAGFTVLMATAGVLLALGAATSVLRDADPEVQAAAARLESLPPAVAPTRASYWPVLGALSAVVAAIGLVASPVLFVIGVLGALIVTLEWMVSAWSERATGDALVNRRIRNRLMYPIEIPVFAALGILLLVVSLSRVLLAVSRIGSSVVAIVVATLIAAVAFLFAYRPKVGKDVIAGVATVFALALVAGGIVGAASGTRTFEHHEAEHSTDEDEAGEPGTDDPTDASGGPDAGAEEDPVESNDTGADEGEPAQDGDVVEEDEGDAPVAEGTDEDVVGDGDPEVTEDEDPAPDLADQSDEEEG